MIKWVPNILTLSRLPIAYLVAQQAIDRNWAWAFILLVVGLLTDWLDGYLAEKLNARSYLGGILEGPCDLCLTIGALWGLVFTHTLSWIVVGILAVILCVIWVPIIFSGDSRLGQIGQGLAPLYYLTVILIFSAIYAFKVFGGIALWILIVTGLALAIAALKLKRHRLIYWRNLIARRQ